VPKYIGAVTTAPRRLALGTIVILVLTACALPYYLWSAASEFMTHPYYGMAIARQTGYVAFVYRGQTAEAAGIRRGDRVLDVPHGDILLGLQFAERHVDPLRVATAHGIVTIHPQPQYPPIGSAIAQFAVQISGLIVIGFAVLLYVRRPGMMSLAFWLWAVLQVSDEINVIERFPPVLGLIVFLARSGVIVASIPLVSFALRFPGGKLEGRARWADALVWIGFGCGTAFFAADDVLWLEGYTPNILENAVLFDFTALPLALAGAILLWRFWRSGPADRAKTAWAIAGFGGSILAQAASYVVLTIGFVIPIVARVGYVPGIESRALLVLANLFPLMAIYPILRYRLFDLGFAINRAALYSTLTLAAVGILAGVNWLAQHLITVRLALVLQPVAAIVVGLGFLRVREWTQTLLERIFFRERFAAERRLDATIRGLPLAERPSAIDAALTGEATDALSLQSAAVFRAHGDTLTRTAAVDWELAELDALGRDEPLLHRLRTEGPVLRLESVVAIALAHADAFVGVAFYGRHRNGTEIDPVELALLRRLCEAAAVAYQLAEMRAELAQLRAQGELVHADV
jgi:hypothetical protein